ncbi:hypothetical protein EDB85DRAFT_216980 [Lactarius pseudohatsudake]|nr:hypothetical protein EDB85DRAFT_216980 [Lactarius pseudohatsudake]
MKGHCIRTLHKVADQTDAVLLVLDARDATGAAASWSRRRCEVADKRLVFVFNMIDPVPRENAQVFAEGPPPRDPNDAFPPVDPDQLLLWHFTGDLLYLFEVYDKRQAGHSALLLRQPDLTLSSAQDTRVKVRSVTSRPVGRTKELLSVRLEHVLRMVDSPGDIISSDGGIQGQ